MAGHSLRASIVCLIIATPLFAQGENPAIVAEVENYLRESSASVRRGTEAYYALNSLDQALRAFKEGNHGIGSVVFIKWKGKVHEFRDRNAMVTGFRLRDHAEARALDRAVVHLAELRGRRMPEAERARVGGNIEPDETYEVDTEFLRGLPDGLHVYGTLEPCPMCVVMMLNVGVKTSISLARDGELKMVGGQLISDGGAMATEEKFKGVPQAWQLIRARQGLEFKLYRGDKKLSDLGLRIFLETRKTIDKTIGDQSS